MSVYHLPTIATAAAITVAAVGTSVGVIHYAADSPTENEYKVALGACLSKKMAPAGSPENAVKVEAEPGGTYVFMIRLENKSKVLALKRDGWREILEFHLTIARAVPYPYKL